MYFNMKGNHPILPVHHNRELRAVQVVLEGHLNLPIILHPSSLAHDNFMAFTVWLFSQIFSYFRVILLLQLTVIMTKLF